MLCKLGQILNYVRVLKICMKLTISNPVTRAVDIIRSKLPEQELADFASEFKVKLGDRARYLDFFLAGLLFQNVLSFVLIVATSVLVVFTAVSLPHNFLFNALVLGTLWSVSIMAFRRFRTKIESRIDASLKTNDQVFKNYNSFMHVFSTGGVLFKKLQQRRVNMTPMVTTMVVFALLFVCRYVTLPVIVVLLVAMVDSLCFVYASSAAIQFAIKKYREYGKAATDKKGDPKANKEEGKYEPAEVGPGNETAPF